MTKAFIVYLAQQKKNIARKEVEAQHARKHLEKQPTACF
jgi:hypothetical protein